MEKEDAFKIKIDLIKWIINTVVIGLLTFFFTWILSERKQGVEEIKVYNTYVDLVTKVNGLAERRLLAEFFSNVTVSNKLKNGWVRYYDLLDAQYKKEIALQEAIIKNTDTSSAKGKLNLEKAKARKENIENAGLTQPIVAIKNNDIKAALTAELQGFNFLLDKDLDAAILEFGKSENAFNSFHQAYEIERYLKKRKNSDEVRDEKFWKSIYIELLKKYSWKMPDEIEIQLEKNVTI